MRLGGEWLEDPVSYYDGGSAPHLFAVQSFADIWLNVVLEINPMYA